MALGYSGRFSRSDWRKWKDAVRELPGDYDTTEQKFKPSTQNFRAVIRTPRGFDESEISHVKEQGMEIIETGVDMRGNTVYGTVKIAKPKEDVLDD